MGEKRRYVSENRYYRNSNEISPAILEDARAACYERGTLEDRARRKGKFLIIFCGIITDFVILSYISDTHKILLYRGEVKLYVSCSIFSKCMKYSVWLSDAKDADA